MWDLSPNRDLTPRGLSTRFGPGGAHPSSLRASIAAADFAGAETGAVPEGFTRPGPVTERGFAPGLQAKVIHQGPGDETTYALIFGKGDEVMSGLTEFAEAQKLTAGYFQP